jgi:hypothetical protein
MTDYGSPILEVPVSTSIHVWKVWNVSLQAAVIEVLFTAPCKNAS